MLTKPIIINNWQGGIADSPYEGLIAAYSKMVGLDYRSYPGALQVERPMEQVSEVSGSDAVIGGPIKWFINISPTEIYAFSDDDAGNVAKVYRSLNTGGTWSLFQTLGSADSPCSANGAIFWKGYFLFCSDSYLGYYKPGGSPEWVLNWKSIQSDIDWHPMLQGQRDGSLYIGASQYIALLSEVAEQTFDPANSATYSFNNQALDIPSDFRVKSLAETGPYLMLGCWKRVGSNHFPVAVLYPWNYVLRPLSHEAPLFKNKVLGVNAQLNIDNVLYAWLGSHGEVFEWNGAKFNRLKRIPYDTSSTGAIDIYPGAVKEFLNMPHFGIINSLTFITGGVYNLGTTDVRRYPLSLCDPYPLSPGNNKNYDLWSLGVCGVADNILLAGWYCGTDSKYGIDKLNIVSRLATGAYFETMLLRVGTAREKAKIDQFEIYLDIPIESGQAIDIKYRTNTSGSWTTVKTAGKTYTFSYDDDGAVSQIYLPFNINNLVNIQFKVEFTAGGNATPILMEIRVQ